MAWIERILQEKAFVEKELGDRVICERCGTTLRDYDIRCSGELFEECPGFLAIEAAKAKFRASHE